MTTVSSTHRFQLSAIANICESSEKTLPINIENREIFIAIIEEIAVIVVDFFEIIT